MRSKRAAAGRVLVGCHARQLQAEDDCCGCGPEGRGEQFPSSIEAGKLASSDLYAWIKEAA